MGIAASMLPPELAHLAANFIVRANVYDNTSAPTPLVMSDPRRFALAVTASSGGNAIHTEPTPSVAWGVPIPQVAPSGMPMTFREWGTLVQQAWFVIPASFIGAIAVYEILWAPQGEGC